MMASVIDTAGYIIAKQGEMSAIKLQKLVYYSQAWSLVWDEAELFPEEIQAWAGGPVVPTLYDRHRGQFRVTNDMLAGADSAHLNEDQKETVDRVIDFYGQRSPQWLSDLTHLEDPWVKARARAGALPGAFCRETITLADMAEYYAGLMDDPTEQASS